MNVVSDVLKVVYCLLHLLGGLGNSGKIKAVKDHRQDTAVSSYVGCYENLMIELLQLCLVDSGALLKWSGWDQKQQTFTELDTRER